MSTITLALALLYLPPSIDALCSASTCEELSWLEGSSYGSQYICGESARGAMQCSGKLNAANAKLYCEGHGGRLCTMSELEADETRGSGCGYDSQKVWSSDSCNNGAGFMTVSGATTSNDLADCTDANLETHSVARCCADFKSSPACADGSCFHGNGTVLLESGASKRLSELNIGDRIKTSDDKGEFSFSPVVTLPHKKNTEAAAFLTLTTETGKNVDMTSDHLIPKCNQDISTAGELVVGDCVFTIDGKETLIEITTTEKSGVYTAVTQNKFIVVDGIVASPYSSSSKDDLDPEQVYEKYRQELKELMGGDKLKNLRGTLNLN